MKDDVLTLRERAALLQGLPWSGEVVEVAGGPEPAWEVSLKLVMEDVLAEGAVAVTPRLVDWCAHRDAPAQSALAVSTLAIYAAARDEREVLDALTGFTGLGLS